MGDYRTTMGEEKPVPPRAARRRRLYWILAVLLVLGGLIYGGIAIKVDRYITAAGYVTTEEYAEVRPAMAGAVAEILVSSGDRVARGDVLVRLDAEQERAALEEARRRVQKMEVDLSRRRTELETVVERSRLAIEEQKRNHKDAIDIARLQLRDAQTKLARTRELVERGLKAGSALEDDKLKEELVQTQLASLLAKDLTVYDSLLERDRAAHVTELRGMEAEISALEDVVRRYEAQLKAKEVRAPIDGQVLRYEFVIGELVRPETVLYEIFGGDAQVLKLRVAERHAARVATGQRYRALLSSYRGLQRVYFRGKVEYLRHVIQNEAQTTYRVAYCSFDPGEYVIPPGTTAEARLYYGRSCLWFYLFNIDI
ncbi:MAG: HlyD family efflux transporter periplasmic adaptor subunit [Lentisphaerae bacterium]|nr:HlyD family efflux transporter periplasmic adaptor subunit [Lentisphaerota bacterium]